VKTIVTVNPCRWALSPDLGQSFTFVQDCWDDFGYAFPTPIMTSGPFSTYSSDSWGADSGYINIVLWTALVQGSDTNDLDVVLLSSTDGGEHFTTVTTLTDAAT
jgi:hypothetical protein